MPNTPSDEKLYRSFRQAPVQKLEESIKTFLAEHCQSRATTLHRALQERSERERPTVKILMEKLGASSFPPLTGPPPPHDNQIIDAAREKLSRRKGLAPATRVIRRGSFHALDVPPYDSRLTQVTNATSGSAFAASQTSAQLSSDDQVFINGGAGFGASGVVIAGSWFGMYFSPPTVLCGDETSGLLTFTTPVEYFGNAMISDRFSFNSVELTVNQMILAFDLGGNRISFLPAATASQPMFSESGWNVFQNEQTPMLNGACTLQSNLWVDSDHYYACLVGCEINAQSDGGSDANPFCGGGGFIEATIPWMAFDLWP